MATGKQSRMGRLGVLLLAVSGASFDAAMGQPPALERAPAPLRRFTAKYFQPANPGPTAGGAAMRTDSMIFPYEWCWVLQRATDARGGHGLDTSSQGRSDEEPNGRQPLSSRPR
jgi:hypothetical protein